MNEARRLRAASGTGVLGARDGRIVEEIVAGGGKVGREARGGGVHNIYKLDLEGLNDTSLQKDSESTPTNFKIPSPVQCKRIFWSLPGVAASIRFYNSFHGASGQFVRGPLTNTTNATNCLFFELKTSTSVDLTLGYSKVRHIRLPLFRYGFENQIHANFIGCSIYTSFITAGLAPLTQHAGHEETIPSGTIFNDLLVAMSSLPSHAAACRLLSLAHTSIGRYLRSFSQMKPGTGGNALLSRSEALRILVSMKWLSKCLFSRYLVKVDPSIPLGLVIAEVDGYLCTYQVVPNGQVHNQLPSGSRISPGVILFKFGDFVLRDKSDLEQCILRAKKSSSSHVSLTFLFRSEHLHSQPTFGGLRKTPMAASKFISERKSFWKRWASQFMPRSYTQKSVVQNSLHKESLRLDPVSYANDGKCVSKNNVQGNIKPDAFDKVSHGRKSAQRTGTNSHACDYNKTDEDSSVSVKEKGCLADGNKNYSNSGVIHSASAVHYKNRNHAAQKRRKRVTINTEIEKSTQKFLCNFQRARVPSSSSTVLDTSNQLFSEISSFSNFPDNMNKKYKHSLFAHNLRQKKTTKSFEVAHERTKRHRLSSSEFHCNSQNTAYSKETNAERQNDDGRFSPLSIKKNLEVRDDDINEVDKAIFIYDVPEHLSKESPVSDMYKVQQTNVKNDCAVEDESHICPECGRICKNRKGLSKHKYHCKGANSNSDEGNVHATKHSEQHCQDDDEGYAIIFESAYSLGHLCVSTYSLEVMDLESTSGSSNFDSVNIPFTITAGKFRRAYLYKDKDKKDKKDVYSLEYCNGGNGGLVEREECILNINYGLDPEVTKFNGWNGTLTDPDGEVIATRNRYSRVLDTPACELPLLKVSDTMEDSPAVNDNSSLDNASFGALQEAHRVSVPCGILIWFPFVLLEQEVLHREKTSNLENSPGCWKEAHLIQGSGNTGLVICYGLDSHTLKFFYEGIGAHYSLEMKDDCQRRAFFNGENGVLRDSDGNEILCKRFRKEGEFSTGKEPPHSYPNESKRNNIEVLDEFDSSDDAYNNSCFQAALPNDADSDSSCTNMQNVHDQSLNIKRKAASIHQHNTDNSNNHSIIERPLFKCPQCSFSCSDLCVMQDHGNYMHKAICFDVCSVAFKCKLCKKFRTNDILELSTHQMSGNCLSSAFH